MKTLVGHKGMVFTVEMNDSTELVYSGGRRNVRRINSDTMIMTG